MGASEATEDENAKDAKEMREFRIEPRRHDEHDGKSDEYLSEPTTWAIRLSPFLYFVVPVVPLW
jgi:hypothetical protein